MLIVYTTISFHILCSDPTCTQPLTLKDCFSRFAAERSFYVSFRGVALSKLLTRTSCPTSIAIFPAPDLLEDFSQQRQFIDIRGCGFHSIFDPTMSHLKPGILLTLFLKISFYQPSTSYLRAVVPAVKLRRLASIGWSVPQSCNEHVVQVLELAALSGESSFRACPVLRLPNDQYIQVVGIEMKLLFVAT